MVALNDIIKKADASIKDGYVAAAFVAGEYYVLCFARNDGEEAFDFYQIYNAGTGAMENLAMRDLKGFSMWDEPAWVNPKHGQATVK